MATVREIIEGAVVELGARALGDTLDAVEAARGLAVLQAMYREAIEQGVFGRLEEVVATEDGEAEEQQRVYTAGYAITLPTDLTDDDTGLPRRPRDLAMIQLVNDGEDPEISVYDAHTAAWTRVDNLTLDTNPCPFSGRNRQGLEAALARRLAATFQKPIPPSTEGVANGLRSVLTNRYSAPRTTTRADFF